VKKSLLLAAVCAAALSGHAYAQTRDHVSVKGSSTVLPFSTVMAEHFAKANPKLRAPVVESGGSSAGLKEFCKGVGANSIDIANSSRPIKPSEVDECKKNGVSEIMELKIGYDGIVFAVNSKNAAMKGFALTTKQIYLALAAQVPQNGKLVANPFKTWKDVDPSLPDVDIVAFIPGEKHGTREVFEEKVMAEGCKQAPEIKALTDEKARHQTCVRVRKDGGTVDIDGDYTETLARVSQQPNAVGVFGLSFYENNRDKIAVASVNGVQPTLQTIAKGEYPFSRPLFIYVKKAHMGQIPGLNEFVSFSLSPAMIGPNGAAVKKGLIPMPNPEAQAVRAAVKAGKVL
jgi:phosphate transport system substrate-binding protein